jgi:hypothetical protein
MIGIGRRRPIFGNTCSFTLRLLFLDTLQLLNQRNTMMYGAYYLLKLHFLLFPEATDFDIHLSLFFLDLGLQLLALLFSPLEFLLHLVVLGTDLLKVLKGGAQDVALGTAGMDIFGTTRRIEIGYLTGRLATSLTSRTRGHGDRPRKNR